MFGISLWDLAFFVLLAALFYALLRPGAPTATALVAVTDATAGLVGTATGYAFEKGG